MNCKTFKKLIPGYLYGESSFEEKEMILDHARSCPDCRNLLDEMSAAVALLREKDESHFSAGEMAALRLKVKQAVAEMEPAPIHLPARTRLRIFSQPLLLPTAGALIAASIAAILLFYPAETPEYLVSDSSNGAEELVAMTETVEEEYDSIDELCREIDELQLLFFEESDPGSEAEIGGDNLSVSA